MTMTSEQRDALQDNDQLLTTGEAAKLMKVQRATFVAWCKSGKYPPDKIIMTLGGHRRVRLSDVIAMMSDFRTG